MNHSKKKSVNEMGGSSIQVTAKTRHKCEDILKWRQEARHEYSSHVLTVSAGSS